MKRALCCVAIAIAGTAAADAVQKNTPVRHFDKSKMERLYRALMAIRVGLDGQVRKIDFERMVTQAEIERKVIDAESCTPDEKKFLIDADVATAFASLDLAAWGFLDSNSKSVKDTKDRLDEVQNEYLGRTGAESAQGATNPKPLPPGESYRDHLGEKAHLVRISVDEKDFSSCKWIEDFELNGSYGDGQRWPSSHDRFVSIESTAKSDGGDAVLLKEASAELVRASVYRCSESPK